jgi:hypothetical protein
MPSDVGCEYQDCTVSSRYRHNQAGSLIDQTISPITLALINPGGGNRME